MRGKLHAKLCGTKLAGYDQIICDVSIKEKPSFWDKYFGFWYKKRNYGILEPKKGFIRKKYSRKEDVVGDWMFLDNIYQKLTIE